MTATSTRLDEEVLAGAHRSSLYFGTGRDRTSTAASVCMLKADVEGYEPQVLLTAERLLRQGHVRAVQLELNRVDDHEQVEANIDMLTHLLALNFSIWQQWRSNPRRPVHNWRAHSAEVFNASFRRFPLPGYDVSAAWARQFGVQFSTNVIAVRSGGHADNRHEHS